jgi:hypothetical protein
MLDFRWIAFLALWTLLAGPVFSPPQSSSPPPAVAAKSPR